MCTSEKGYSFDADTFLETGIVLEIVSPIYCCNWLQSTLFLF